MKAPLCRKPRFDGGRHLDLQLARKIVASQQLETACPQSTADLTAFLGITPDAIRYLAQFPYTWVDFGLSQLGKALAQEIAAWPAEVMSFRDGMETTPEALACFHLCPATLRFGNIGEAIDSAAAQALSACAGSLELAVDILEPETAAFLANHCGFLEIRVHQPASPASIQALAQHLGDECRLFLGQPLTPELMAHPYAASNKRLLDLGPAARRNGYCSALLLCSEARYAEILSGLDLKKPFA